MSITLNDKNKIFLTNLIISNIPSTMYKNQGEKDAIQNMILKIFLRNLNNNNMLVRKKKLHFKKIYPVKVILKRKIVKYLFSIKKNKTGKNNFKIKNNLHYHFHILCKIFKILINKQNSIKEKFLT